MTSEEQLASARRMIDGDGGAAPSRSEVAEGAKIVRSLAEDGDCLEAWRYMLDCHERGIGPFKTNKFRRAAKEAIARHEVTQKWIAGRADAFSTDLSWCDVKPVRDLMLRRYANARRQRDKFVEDRVKPLVTDQRLASAASRLRLDWKNKNFFSETVAFGLIEFATMYDDSDGFVPVDRAIETTKRGLDPDYDAAIEMLSNLRYTWSKVLDVKPGCGLKCRDLLTGGDFFLLERNLSRGPVGKDFIIVSGVMPVGDCFMHTGYSLPLPDDKDDPLEKILDSALEELGYPRKRGMFGGASREPVHLTRAQTAKLASSTIASWVNSPAAESVKMLYL